MNDIWSFSKLSSYHNCRYAWYLTYVLHEKGEDNVYGVLGNSIHDSLELMCKDEMTIEEAKEKFKQDYDMCKFLGMNFPTENTEKKYIYDIEHAFDYFEKPKGRLEEERYIEFEIENKKFRGYVDLIIFDDENKTIQVLDWKSSSKFSKKDLESHKVFQLILYSMYLEKEYPDYKILNPAFYMLKYARVKNDVTGRESIRERIDIDDTIHEVLEPYIVEVQYNDNMKDKLKQYINEVTLDIAFNDEEEESDWYPTVEELRNNTFYCKNLCSHKKSCKFYKGE